MSRTAPERNRTFRATSPIAMQNAKLQDLTPILEEYFSREADRLHVACAFLYGSWAGGLPRPDSDVDISVLFEDDADDDTVFQRLTEMSLALSRLLHRDVEILPIRADFRKPFLCFNAIVRARPVYFRSAGRLRKLQREALFQMEDYSLFGPRWQAALAAKNLEALKHA